MNEIKDDDTGEVFLSLDPMERKQRSVMLACMKNVHNWDEAPRNEFKNIILSEFQLDKAFFKELLTNGENDCSPLLYAHKDVSSDEEILFLAMEADKYFGRMANAFSIFATEDQRRNKNLVNRILDRFPEAKEYL